MSIGDSKSWTGSDEREFSDPPETEDSGIRGVDLGSTETHLAPNGAEQSGQLKKKATAGTVAQKENDDESQPF